MESEIQKAPRSQISDTTRWFITTLIVLLVQACATFFWAAALEAQVNANTEDILSLQEEIKDIDKDIRDILLGIEQVKARLGIVEVTETGGR
jgi:peptidoglycan hydrolase CwlO-like protein